MQTLFMATTLTLMMIRLMIYLAGEGPITLFASIVSLGNPAQDKMAINSLADLIKLKNTANYTSH